MIRPTIYSAVTTAFHDDGTIDTASTRRVFEHALAGGVDALFLNGTTAEFAALSREERGMLLQAAVGVAGAERVVAHVGSASPYETARLAADAHSLGIRTLSVLTPFYMPSSLDGVRAQVEAARAAAPGASIFLYLFPDRTGVQVDPADAARLIEELDLAGAKISIAGTDYLAALVGALATPRTVLSGNDGLLREVLAAGGSGVVSGVSSSMPQPFVALAQALERGDAEAADRIAATINEIVPVLGPSIAGLKASQREQGLLESAVCRMAIDPVDAEHLQQIKRVVTRRSSDPAFSAA